MTFQHELDRAYNKKVLEQLSKTVRAVALVVDRELVNTTPVDTGRARANWMPSLNVPSDKKVEPKQGMSVDVIFSEYTLKDTILITNNLPYIQRLNDGYSKQAPAGFVDSAIDKGMRAVKR